jgi:hypothetical protein
MRSSGIVQVHHSLTFGVFHALCGSVKAAACLLAPTCLGLGSDVIAAFEGGLIGTWALRNRLKKWMLDRQFNVM